MSSEHERCSIRSYSDVRSASAMSEIVPIEMGATAMRAALKAALGARKGSGSKIVELLRAGHPNSGTTDDVDLQAAACIEDLAGALQKLDTMIREWARDQGFPVEHSSCWQVVRAALERWDLK